MTQPPAIPAAPTPDDKDWTWILDQPCGECGFDSAAVTGRDVPALVRNAVARWQTVLARADATARPEPQRWSALEYGCHLRDVFDIFAGRTGLMLVEDNPTFANWDQDETALADRYWEQSPGVVSAQLAAAGAKVAEQFSAVREDQWQRVGLRSNGSVFTVDSLGRYFVHDVVHHLWDVAG
jgi:hypothetical protein